MCNLSQVFIDDGFKKGMSRGIAKGISRGMAKNFITLMKKTNQTVDEVLELLDIDESLRPDINKLIHQKER